jgi:hypothetical protein
MRKLVALVVLWAAAGTLCAAGNLCENGAFEDAADPLKGWNTDYRWTGNSNYSENYGRVKVVTQEGAKRNALSVDGRNTGDAGAKVESKPIAVQPGARYRAKLNVKGGPARVYFAGYKWKPGVRPVPNPELGQLRAVYKSKPYVGEPRAWTPVSLQFPMDNPSPAALKQIKEVRFITVYVWSNGDTYIDDVAVEQVGGK